MGGGNCFRLRSKTDSRFKIQIKSIGNWQSAIGNAVMYRKPRFLEVLHEIREEMSREADYDVDLFAERIRSEEGSHDEQGKGKRTFTIKSVIIAKKRAARRKRKRKVGS
jgi:hypothetical protein